MVKRKKQKTLFGTVPRVFALCALLILLYILLIHGTDVAVLNPKGLIATEQRRLLLFSAAVLFGIAIPTLAIIYFFAWRFREKDSDDLSGSDQGVVYKTSEPTDRRGFLFLFIVWGIPFALFVFLSMVMWSATHRLEPQKPIAATTQTQTIEVIALRWKWLFIYPEQHIATVNFVQIPTDTPVRFDLTADEAPMSSFWIPHLAGQLYAMTGHVNPLNLVAKTPGDYTGSSAEINGAGFAAMRFTTRVSSRDDFDHWVEGVQQSTQQLDDTAYQQLLVPSENNPVQYYGYADQNIYATVLQKYAESHNHEVQE